MRAELLQLEAEDQNRRELLADLQAQSRTLREKCVAADGCTEPLPRVTGDVESDIESHRKFIRARQFQMAQPAFSAASAAHGRTDAPEAKSNPAAPSAASALLALSAISPAQAILLSQYEAVEGDRPARDRFVREHAQELQSLAVALHKTKVTTSTETVNEPLLAAYQAVENQPLLRDAFVAKHATELQALLIRMNNPNR